MAAPERGEPRPASVYVAPAIVSFNGATVSAGEPVLLMAGVVADVIVPGIKRLLGRHPSDEVVKRLAARSGFDASARGDDLELFPAEGRGATGSLTAEDATAVLWRHAIGEVTDHRGPHQAVVAVPGWFGVPQHKALMRVAKKANVRILRFIQDVVASSLWAAHAHRVTGRVLAIDVGAGGVSAALMQLDPRTVERLQAGGSVACGGDDVDAQLAATAIEAPGPRAWELVRQACESLKRELADAEAAVKKVNLGDASVTLEVERWELELMLGGVSQAIGETVKQVFTGRGDTAADVTGLLAFGGMCGVAGVLREIESLADPTVVTGPPRLESTALGALRLGMALTGSRPIRHQVIDGEGEETAADLTTPAAPVAATPLPASVLQSAPVVKQKAVLRRRPEVVTRRVDPREARRPRDRGSVRPPPSDAIHEGEADRRSSIPASRDAAAEPRDAPARPSELPARPPAEPATPRRPGRSMPRVMSRRSESRSDSSSPPAEPPPMPRAPSSSSRAPSRLRPSSPRPSSPPPAPIAARVSSDPPSSEPPLAGPAPRKAQMPPPRAAAKYPARDGMPRYPMKDRALRAPAVPQADAPRRSATTQPSVRPPAAPEQPISTPPGDPLGPGSDPHSEPPFSYPPSHPPSFPPHGYPTYTTPPRGAAPSLAPSQIPTEGLLVTAPTAAELLAQPITRPLTPDDLHALTLPVLLRRVLARRSFFGTCEIRAKGFELRLDCEGGTCSVTKSEYTQLLKAFDLEEAEWRTSSAREEEPMREPIPLARIALDGLRRQLREQPADACRAALGDRLALAPRVRSERRRIPKRLGLSGRELRFIENYFDGMQSGAELGDTGPLGASTCFQLLILLELYDAIEWSPVDEIDEAPIAAKLHELADKLDSSNFFDVLQVHWSAGDDEIAARYEQRKAEFAPGSNNARLNAVASARIDKRLDKAWAVLKDKARRVEHRNASYEGQDFAAATELAARRSRDLEMRGRAAEAREQESRAREIARSISQPAMKATKPPSSEG